MKRTLLSLIVLSAGCGWANLPDTDNTYLEEPIWDAANPISTTDGVYVRMPLSGGLTLVQPNGQFRTVDIGQGEVNRIQLAPDNQTVLAFVNEYRCDEDDPRELKKMEFVRDCPFDKRIRESRLLTLREGSVQSELSVPPLFNSLGFSEDGQWAIAYVDFENVSSNDATGVVDLTSVVVMDLSAGQTTSLSVGFAADRVLFSEDASRAVVLSKNSVAVIDLTGDEPTKDVTFPLTLDADQTVEPVGVELTPDGRYALISVRNAADLYVLDLDLHSVNLVSLSANPSAMRVVKDADPYDDIHDDRTIVVYKNGSVVDVMEHQYFDLESYTLDEPMSDVVAGEDFALLYTTNGGHDAYRLDLDTNELLEYRLENPARSMHLSPTNEVAIALTWPEYGSGSGVDSLYDNSPGMEILDLTGDKAKSRAYLLEGQGIGLAYSATEGALHAMVLQDDVEYLYQLNLYTNEEQQVDLSKPAVTIGSVPSGEFFITHISPLGLITFFDPNSGQTIEASGFGIDHLQRNIRLLKEEEAS